MNYQELSTTANTPDAVIGVWLHVSRPNGELAYSVDENGVLDKTKPCRIQLVGKDSPQYQKVQAALSRKYQLAQQRHRNKYVLPFDEALADNRALIVACVVGVENLDNGDRPLVPADFADVFATVPDLYEQCKDFVEDRANFLPMQLVA